MGFFPSPVKRRLILDSFLHLLSDTTVDEVFSELERVCHDEEILFGALLEDADAEAQ